MGCGASHGLHSSSAYTAATEPKVKEPLSEEQLMRLQAQTLRHMMKRMLSAAWQGWMAFHQIRRAQLKKERRAKKVLSKLRNLPFVQCKPPHLASCYPR